MSDYNKFILREHFYNIIPNVEQRYRGLWWTRDVILTDTLFLNRFVICVYKYLGGQGPRGLETPLRGGEWGYARRVPSLIQKSSCFSVLSLTFLLIKPILFLVPHPVYMYFVSSLYFVLNFLSHSSILSDVLRLPGFVRHY